MKKIIGTIALSLLFGSALLAQNRSVSFEHGTFAEALAKAKENNKLIFFDGFTDWCGPCKYMANKVFTQDKVADFFNENFINVKFDMEKGEGIELAKKYQVRAFPTFLLLDSTGKLIHKIVGGDEADGFIEKVKEGLNPETSLAGKKDKYESGKYDTEFVKGYLSTLQNAYMETEAEEVAQQYLRSLKENQRVSKENWFVYKDFVNDPMSKDFIFILTNRLKFTDAVGDSSINAKINSVFTSKSLAYLANRRGKVYSQDEVAKLREFIKSSSVDNGAKYIALLNMADVKAAKDGVLLSSQLQDFVKNNTLSDQECYSILSVTVPTIAENASKTEWLAISAIIDGRIASLKEEKAKPYFERVKEQLSNKLNDKKENQ